MGCPNDSVVGWWCAESAGCSAAAAAEYAETVDSADNFHLVLQNVVDNSKVSCSGGGCWCWTAPETGTCASVHPVPCACSPSL